MRRAFLLLPVLLLVLGPGAPAASPAAPAVRAKTETVSVPRLLQHVLPHVRDHTDVDVLLPSRLRVDGPVGRLHGRGDGHGGSYELSLAFGRRCGGATACFVASFTAERGARPGFRRAVRLRGGRRGYYKPLTCGASCSPPMLQWLQGDVLYSIQAQAGPRRTERATMVRLANSAIAGGPR
jgi:hypothetical protein